MFLFRLFCFSFARFCFLPRRLFGFCVGFFFPTIVVTSRSDGVLLTTSRLPLFDTVNQHGGLDLKLPYDV